MNKIVLSVAILFSVLSQNFAQKPDSTLIPLAVPSKMDTVATDDDETEFQTITEIDTLPKWFYSVGLDGTTSSGNVNRQLLNFRTSLSFESKKYVFGFFSTPRFQYGTNSDILQERELFIDLNSTLFYAHSNVYLLFFGGFEQSNLRKILTRYDVGVGVGLKIFGGIKKPKSHFKLSVTNALVKEVTDFEIKQDKNVFRNSTRLRLSYAIIPEKLTFQSVVFLQPSLTDSYYRWNSLTSISYKVGKHLAFLASIETTYENFNVVGIQNAQSNATIGLTYSGSN